MKPGQLTKAIVLLGTTQAELARTLWTNERTVRRWVTGDWPIPPAVAMLLNLMLDTQKRIADLRD